MTGMARRKIKNGSAASSVDNIQRYNTESKKYIFIEQYKVAADGVTVEVINGSVDEDEKPQQSIMPQMDFPPSFCYPPDLEKL